MIKTILFLVFLIGISAVSFAQVAPNVGQIERSQELMRDDEALRKKFEASEKIYIEEITVEGANLLTKKEIEDLTLPYKKKWLTKDGIRRILNEFEDLYRHKGLTEQLPVISCQIENKRLIITIKESAH